MTANFDSTRVPLDDARFLKLTDAAGTTIHCVDGCLWATRDGVFEDILLTPGQSYVVEGRSRVVVTGLGPSLAQVSRPSPARPATARRKLGALMVALGILLPGSSWAQPEEWACPPVEKVGLLPISPGWIAQDTVMYPYQAPSLRFESMEIGPHGPAAVCKYRVVGSGLISIWKFGRCHHGKGAWKAAGPKSYCEASEVEASGVCSLVCTPA